MKTGPENQNAEMEITRGLTRRGAHAAGVLFSAARRKLRSPVILPERQVQTGARWFGRAAQTSPRAAGAPQPAAPSGFHRRGSAGYALLTVMIFSSIGLLALGTAMQWTNQSAMLNERATESRAALLAAEATTEKVVAAMSADFQRGGETLVHANTPAYTALLPTAAEDPYWQNFQFADGRGNNGATYVQRISTRVYKPLESRFTGLNGFISEYVIASHARSTDGRYNPANAVEQRLQLASIPVFQFAVFFNGLMEFTWAAPFTVRGRVHGNNHIYTGSSQPLTFVGDVTSVGVQTTRSWGGYDISAFTGSLTYSGKRATNAAAVSLPIGTNNTDAAVREIILKPPAGEPISSAMGHERFYNKAELLILVSNTTITASVKQPYDGARVCDEFVTTAGGRAASWV
ncbi:hypothetical protein LBMAG56_47660 [Verrucomicrobiota bacterium]|nr:hypothetical protein LBMAG56_47660 [Verrucomicrobiota bacterium]